MSLSVVIAKTADVLRTAPGAHEVLTVPPVAALPDGRTFLVIERPGVASAHAHPDRYWMDDTLLIEFHRAIRRDEDNAEAVVTDARTMHDWTRDALWSALLRKALGPVFGSTGLRTELFGPMEYGASLSFGFRLAFELTHGAAATAAGR